MTTQTESAWVPTDTFANRLVLVRRDQRLSVKEAAERCGVKHSTWSLWENGTKPSDLLRTVTAISDTLGVDRGWLMFGGSLAKPGNKVTGGYTDWSVLDLAA